MTALGSGLLMVADYSRTSRSLRYLASLSVAPDEYFNGDFKGETPFSLAWSDAVDAMKHACIEVEKLLKLLAEKAGLPPPETNLSDSDERPAP
ncbi:MAG: hypothetical protein IID41_11980 [Planctomycetes bacterium]|nr:hypothetical protein [Planctomycetota bacterium]